MSPTRRATEKKEKRGEKRGQVHFPGSVVALGGGSTVMGLLAGYLKEDTVSAGAWTLLAVSRGLSPVQASRLSRAISAADGWDYIVDSISK